MVGLPGFLTEKELYARRREILAGPRNLAFRPAKFLMDFRTPLGPNRKDVVQGALPSGVLVRRVAQDMWLEATFNTEFVFEAQ